MICRKAEKFRHVTRVRIRSRRDSADQKNGLCPTRNQKSIFSDNRFPLCSVPERQINGFILFDK